MDNWLEALPKADLHLHLDGCVKPSTLLALAADRAYPLPADNAEDLLPYMQVDAGCDSLTTYLEKFSFVLPLLQDAPALKRVAKETVEQAATRNCLYIEVRFAPALHTSEGLTPEDAIAAVLDGLKRGEMACGIVARLIVICMRHHDDRINLPVIQAAVALRGQGVAAVDLAGDEASHPAEKFRGTFAAAREAGIPITIHAGEAAGPFNIREAVEGLGAMRIGHGIRLREDPGLLDWIRERRIPLEMCPTSNIQTRAVADWDDYPIRAYYDAGLYVTVNTDNPTVSGTDMTRECETIASRFGFTPAELAGLMRAALLASFAEPPVKQRLLARFDEIAGRLMTDVSRAD
ncbi:adenosine deaminase [Cohnella rhizosphaerae]|uniref:adenosine deaminase n=1 Tax=Cohnella rhizosphaerae TaxID=1457232 RepID=A0A9X4KXT6_9BACL|nr:adenosine deaminase [Cohnella rhizosphaerae]MDG0813261.1 adenosine deaminase [Cohnella rhizosphaerae]